MARRKKKKGQDLPSTFNLGETNKTSSTGTNLFSGGKTTPTTESKSLSRRERKKAGATQTKDVFSTGKGSQN